MVTSNLESCLVGVFFVLTDCIMVNDQFLSPPFTKQYVYFYIVPIEHKSARNEGTSMVSLFFQSQDCSLCSGDVEGPEQKRPGFWDGALLHFSWSVFCLEKKG